MSDTGRQVVTVRGPIAPDDLGTTLSHDHVLIDAFDLWGGYEWILDDEAIAIAELTAYREAGGGAVADPTNIGIGRDPAGLLRVSEASGVHILMGAGWYRERAYADYVFEEMPDALADRLVRELTEGVDGTDIRAGFIGEIGTERGFISPAQERVFRAAGRAHARTGCPILTHTTHFGELGIEQLDLLAEEGVDAGNVIISHLGDRIGIHWWRALAERGAFLNIDNLGFISGYAPLEVRADNVAAFIADGFIDQVMLSNDICRVDQLQTFGGPGYGNVIERFYPLLRERGVTHAQIETMTVTNPARAFSYEAGDDRKRPAA
jgi:predicted metal-dependent phosphotriesterase family hydrolase